MTMISFGDLQATIYDALTESSQLSILVDGNIFDAPPTGTLPHIYVLIGEENISNRSTITSVSYINEFKISVVSAQSGFLDAKKASSLICKIIDTRRLSIAHGSVRNVAFISARSLRGRIGQRRRIDLIFRAYIDL